nr:hypothetical protein [Cronobacter dublinensis]
MWRAQPSLDLRRRQLAPLAQISLRRGDIEQAVEAMRNGKNTNFRVANKKEAIDLVNQSRGRMPRQGSHNDPYNEPGDSYKKGYEIHPHESHTKNAPENDMPHIKWKDWESGKSNGGRGHVFFDQ